MLFEIVLLSIGFLIFTSLVLWLLVQADREKRRHQARLNRVRRDKMPAPVKMARQKAIRDSETKTLLTWIEFHLAQTSLRLTVTELLVQVALAVLGIYAVSVLFLGLRPVTAVPLAVAGPVILATMVIRSSKNRYRAAFTEQLPEALDVFARGLRAGRPVSDSLNIVVETSEGPINREFTQSHDEICMGTSLSDSLARLEHRVPTPEVSFFSVAVSLQSETGGNLIETMEGLATQLRERRKLRKKARALSSEARASAVILASLPFAVAVLLAVLNGAYLAPLYQDARGQVMSILAVSSIGLGVFMMARMGKLDV